jgi:hypothetical protein
MQNPAINIQELTLHCWLGKEHPLIMRINQQFLNYLL